MRNTVSPQTREMLEQVRRDLHEMVDREVNGLLHRLEFGESVEQTDITLPLTTMPAYFKGKKPVSIITPDGTEIPTGTWLKVAQQLLHDCAADEQMRDRLYNLRDMVSGKNRRIFSSTAEGMNKPIEFYDDMFFEGKFDTETMLKVITTRIFDPIGYDYHRIGIKVVDPRILAMAEQLNISEPQETDQEDDIGMEMTM